MRLFPYTFDDFPLNDRRELYSWFVDPFMFSTSTATVGLVQRAGEFPAFGAVTFTEKTFSVKIVVNHPTTYRNTLTQRINPADKVRRTLKQLVVHDEDTGKFLYIDCYPVSLVCDDDYGKQFTATFTAPNPEWKTVVTKIATKTITASGQTLAITCGGNVPNEPIYKLKPTLQKASGYPYRVYFTVINNASKVAGRTSGAYVNRPVDLTDGAGWDTATLVAAGKMQATGNDLRVFVNNVEVNRWLYGMNTATTRVWVNLNELPYQALTSATNIPATGTIASIAIQTPRSGSVYKLSGYPTQGVLQIGSEQFYYNGLDVKNGIFTIKQRAARGTSMAAHAVGATLYFSSNDIIIIYGDAAAAAPTVDDSYQPLLNLNLSSNALWAWANFGSDLSPNRTAKWTYSGSANHEECGIYTDTHDTDVDPFDILGVVIQPHLIGTKYYTGTVDLSWTLSDPVGFTMADFQGDYYKYASNSLWPVVRLYKENIIVWTLVSPVAYAAWVAWTEHGIALTNTYYKITFKVTGSCAPFANNFLACEANFVYFNLSATRKPTVTKSAEQSSTYEISMTISNTATYEGDTITESLTVVIPSTLNQNIIINTATREVYRENDSLNAVPAVEKDSERLMWLPLYPGLNTLTFTETGLANVTVEVDYQEKFN